MVVLSDAMYKINFYSKRFSLEPHKQTNKEFCRKEIYLAAQSYKIKEGENFDLYSLYSNISLFNLSFGDAISHAHLQNVNVV